MLQNHRAIGHAKWACRVGFQYWGLMGQIQLDHFCKNPN
jgi:hypothetical protein